MAHPGGWQVGAGCERETSTRGILYSLRFLVTRQLVASRGRDLRESKAVVTMCFMIQTWKSHTCYTSLLQYSSGKTGQPYGKWDEITQGHVYKREARITGGRFGGQLSYLILGFNRKVCPVPLMISALNGTRECCHTYIHACWGSITLKRLDFISKTFRD